MFRKGTNSPIMRAKASFQLSLKLGRVYHGAKEGWGVGRWSKRQGGKEGLGKETQSTL
jgi:hypothetical protein